MSRIVGCCCLSDYFSGVVTGLGEITVGGFVPLTSFELCPRAYCCPVSVLTPLGIASGLKVVLICTANIWFIIGKTHGGWKKLDTEFNSAADWHS